MPPLLQGAGEIGDEDKKQQAGRGGLEVLGGRRSSSWFVMEAAPPARGHRWCARCRIVGAALVRSVCHCSFCSTPAQEAYLQSLSKAMSHYHKAQLLLLDITDFSLSRASMRAPVSHRESRTSPCLRRRLEGCPISSHLLQCFLRRMSLEVPEQYNSISSHVSARVDTVYCVGYADSF
ncbi:uncharacterized protein LOC119349163 isoform X2 [Triticum dicoccoides]|uniref:uncharacterized protein LOC119349163 isoform X2 n=1 Tax=Triticum dicoccoides TaxID=85692 RepID=UPI00188F0D28|nr:uncharacterized protein LOC119349163 isoform X2 [Triticum dicoccoides]